MEYKRELTEEEARRLTEQGERDPQRCAMLLLVWKAGLSVAETAGLRWADVDLSVPCLRLERRTVPLVPEAAAALGRLGQGKEWVFPSRRQEGPMAVMSVNRELRLMLDGAGLSGTKPKDLRNQYLLWVMERASLEEAIRVTGYEAETLRDNWREYGRKAPRRPTPAGSAAPDVPALEAALGREGDTLDGRILRLSWQGGLRLREIQGLRWADIAPDDRSWTVGGKTGPVPPPLRPWLREWRARGGEYVAAGPRSSRPLEVAVISRRTARFFARHGLEGMSVSGFRGNGRLEKADVEALLEVVRRRGFCAMGTARKKLGLSSNQVRAAAEELRREGRLSREGGEILCLPGERTSRERFYDALDEIAGETVTAAGLRKLCEIYNNKLYYYVREAAAAGRLRKEGRGRYLVREKDG